MVIQAPPGQIALDRKDYMLNKIIAIQKQAGDKRRLDFLNKKVIERAKELENQLEKQLGFDVPSDIVVKEVSLEGGKVYVNQKKLKQYLTAHNKEEALKKQKELQQKLSNELGFAIPINYIKVEYSDKGYKVYVDQEGLKNFLLQKNKEEANKKAEELKNKLIKEVGIDPSKVDSFIKKEVSSEGYKVYVDKEKLKQYIDQINKERKEKTKQTLIKSYEKQLEEQLGIDVDPNKIKIKEENGKLVAYLDESYQKELNNKLLEKKINEAKQTYINNLKSKFGRNLSLTDSDLNVVVKDGKIQVSLSESGLKKLERAYEDQIINQLLDAYSYAPAPKIRECIFIKDGKIQVSPDLQKVIKDTENWYYENVAIVKLFNKIKDEYGLKSVKEMKPYVVIDKKTGTVKFDARKYMIDKTKKDLEKEYESYLGFDIDPERAFITKEEGGKIKFELNKDYFKNLEKQIPLEQDNSKRLEEINKRIQEINKKEHDWDTTTVGPILVVAGEDNPWEAYNLLVEKLKLTGDLDLLFDIKEAYRSAKNLRVKRSRSGDYFWDWKGKDIWDDVDRWDEIREYKEIAEKSEEWAKELANVKDVVELNKKVKEIRNAAINDAIHRVRSWGILDYRWKDNIQKLQELDKLIPDNLEQLAKIKALEGESLTLDLDRINQLRNEIVKDFLNDSVSAMNVADREKAKQLQKRVHDLLNKANKVTDIGEYHSLISKAEKINKKLKSLNPSLAYSDWEIKTISAANVIEKVNEFNKAQTLEEKEKILNEIKKMPQASVVISSKQLKTIEDKIKNLKEQQQTLIKKTPKLEEKKEVKVPEGTIALFSQSTPQGEVTYNLPISGKEYSKIWVNNLIKERKSNKDLENILKETEEKYKNIHNDVLIDFSTIEANKNKAWVMKETDISQSIKKISDSVASFIKEAPFKAMGYFVSLGSGKKITTEEAAKGIKTGLENLLEGNLEEAIKSSKKSIGKIKSKKLKDALDTYIDYSSAFIKGAGKGALTVVPDVIQGFGYIISEGEKSLEKGTITPVKETFKTGIKNFVNTLTLKEGTKSAEDLGNMFSQGVILGEAAAGRLGKMGKITAALDDITDTFTGVKIFEPVASKIIKTPSKVKNIIKGIKSLKDTNFEKLLDSDIILKDLKLEGKEFNYDNTGYTKKYGIKSKIDIKLNVDKNKANNFLERLVAEGLETKIKPGNNLISFGKKEFDLGNLIEKVNIDLNKIETNTVKGVKTTKGEGKITTRYYFETPVFTKEIKGLKNEEKVSFKRASVDYGTTDLNTGRIFNVEFYNTEIKKEPIVNLRKGVKELKTDNTKIVGQRIKVGTVKEGDFLESDIFKSLRDINKISFIEKPTKYAFAGKYEATRKIRQKGSFTRVGDIERLIEGIGLNEKAFPLIISKAKRGTKIFEKIKEPEEKGFTLLKPSEEATKEMRSLKGFEKLLEMKNTEDINKIANKLKKEINLGEKTKAKIDLKEVEKADIVKDIMKAKTNIDTELEKILEKELEKEFKEKVESGLKNEYENKMLKTESNIKPRLRRMLKTEKGLNKKFDFESLVNKGVKKGFESKGELGIEDLFGKKMKKDLTYKTMEKIFDLNTNFIDNLQNNLLNTKQRQALKQGQLIKQKTKQATKQALKQKVKQELALKTSTKQVLKQDVKQKQDLKQDQIEKLDIPPDLPKVNFKIDERPDIIVDVKEDLKFKTKKNKRIKKDKDKTKLIKEIEKLIAYNPFEGGKKVKPKKTKKKREKKKKRDIKTIKV